MESLYYALRRLPGMSLQEFHDYWLNTHAPLFRAHLETLGARRYVQIHRIDDPLNEALRASWNAMEPFDGLLELGGEREDLVRALSTPEGARITGEMQESLKKFVDKSRSALWVGEPVVIFER
jgi:hypothetical protein